MWTAAGQQARKTIDQINPKKGRAKVTHLPLIGKEWGEEGGSGEKYIAQ